MDRINKSFYKNIIGDTKETIDAIQRFIEKNTPKKAEVSEEDTVPAESVNKIINSLKNEDTENSIQKIIKNL